jgi:plasmid stability protein
MPQLTVRSIGEKAYRRLKERARTNRRSLEAEVRAILDLSVLPDRDEIVRRCNAMRSRLKNRFRGDVTRDIRADRDR